MSYSEKTPHKVGDKLTIAPNWQKKQFIITGNTPSKSNCYRIVSFTSKDASPIVSDCEAEGCENGWVTSKTFFSEEPTRAMCGKCLGVGKISIPTPARYSLAKSPDLKKYEKSFIIQWGKNPFKIDGEFEFEVDVYYPTRRSDLDNSLKVTLDCLQQVGAIKNDNLCMGIVARKFLDKEKPRIEFTIKPMK